MKKYLIINLVFKESVLPELQDLMQDTVKQNCLAIEEFVNSLGAEVLFTDKENTRTFGRSFATVEHNFELSTEQKNKLKTLITEFFIDGELRRKIINTYNTLFAVRFLQTKGELLIV